MKRQLIIAIGIVLLTAGICSADNYVGGIPLTTVKEGVVSGGVYVDSYYGAGNQVNYKPITIDKTFTLPSHTDVEWAMLLTTVYCGHMQNNYEGTANISFNGNAIGDETLNVPFTFKYDGGSGYVNVNDHVSRVSSDYMMWYNVTDLIQTGVNTASVHTEQINAKFDGRIKLITLIVAYNDSSSSTKTYYWTNQGHDVDSYYNDDSLSDYIGNTSFAASLPAEETLQNAELTAVHMASEDGSYTFNNNGIASGTPQGSYCGSNTWDITSSFDSSGTNTMTYNRSGGFYKIALGILTAQSQAQVSTQEADLQALDMSVKHNDYNGAWAHLNNSVNVTVVNNGAGNAGSFNVKLYADDVEVDTLPVSGLAAGATSVVACNWIPEEAKTYTLKAVADSENAINESNETNNELTKSQPVENNGYRGDKPFTTYKHENIKGDMIYTHGNSTYSGKLHSDDTYTVNHDISLPDGASVKFARLYNYWTWSYTGSTGKYPIMNLTFNGNAISPEVQYDDRKGWGTMYDYPTGTWAYDVTSFVTGSGTYTTVVTDTDPDTASSFAMNGLGLLVVYEDQNGQEIEYWINEGADMVNTQTTSGGLTPDEATVESIFSGPVGLSNVSSARLWTVVQSGGNENNTLLFNDMDWTNVYDGSPYADLDIDEARNVKDHLTANDNTAWIRAAPNPGDYLVPSNAFLVLNYNGTQVPALSLSASPTNVTVGVPTDVTFTVTSNNTPVEGADVNLTGSATGSGTTDANGTAVISVNATSVGTITATATKQSYSNATTAVTAAAKPVQDGVSSSVSLGVKIIPVVALNVTPDSINFGELSAGETSGVHTLTIQNKGGYDINVTAGVAATSDDLFKDGLLLDSALYGSYHKTITALASDTADTTLKVPEDYLGVGAKEGALIIWAQQA
jgi:hypothetical protein